MAQQREQGMSYWPLEVTVGDVVYPPGSTLGPRIQPWLQFVFVYAGQITLRIDQQVHVIPANSAFVLYPGHHEYFVFAEDCETVHSWVHLDFTELDPELIARLRQVAWPLPLSPAMQQHMHDALALKKSTFPTTNEILKGLGMQICWRYIGEGEQLATQDIGLAHSAVEQALQYIYEHISEPLTLTQIAEAVSISPAHLIRLFQLQLQTTPMAYVWEQRIAMGIKLLEQTGLSVGMIAERCGFQSRFHFSRRIRQTIGYTPLEVRHRSWQIEV
ncbi:AraC family transcriptional regulator [Dictyobacter alpinus]|uniref:AraC family transcriptional regulator n=1 Tax=Dictyobacter alpinus TaxID=2014873 RepID=A0A402BKD6_9CHLR|nr:AraC family transcriptional regulator [Dictyobacter alpinus]GCE31814.1 AraC family transcriptional regulator [Dictyobacter alpinus]